MPGSERGTKARKTRNAPRPVVAKALCPATNLRYGGRKIMPHALNLTQCANGSLSAWCRLHGVRVFFNAPEITEELLKEFMLKEETNDRE